MKIAVIGGKLQGIEASYLAKKAGWEVMLVDKNPLAPARGLADEFHHLDVVREEAKILPVLKRSDLIVPAVEDASALAVLHRLSLKEGIPLAFDPDSYAVSSSKKRSDILFRRLGLPAPRPWPEASFPLLSKPSESSGSRGVCKIRSQSAWKSLLAESVLKPEDWVIQEFLEGPSFSLEVFGHKGRFLSLQTTTIEVDRGYDCKRVLAPADLSQDLKERFSGLALRIAQALDLKGIMDVEVILHGGELKVLEIDARLPSQTPAAVLKSTGINMIELLSDIFVRDSLPEALPIGRENSVIYEHVRVTPEKMEISGEHVMTKADGLRVVEDFFGAEEAITDYDGGRKKWVATLIFSGSSSEEVWRRRHSTLEEIKKEMNLTVFDDPVPE